MKRTMKLFKYSLYSFLGLVALFLVVGVLINQDNDQSKTQNTPIAEQKQQVSARELNDMANRYYDRHIKLRWSPTDFFGGKLTPENAKKVITICLDELKTKERCEDIINERFWIGMTSFWALLSLGQPDDINTTVVRGLKHEQYVYDNGAMYLYFDNETLVSYQQ